MPELFIVAGEASGDRHAASLLQELVSRDSDIRAVGLGGPELAAAGMEVLEDIASAGIMGLLPVLRNLGRIRSWFRLCEEELERRRPAALLLVDYPGFNLRLAQTAKRLGIPVIYYIAPQVWAWKESRVEKIRRLVDLLIVILPFERAWFEERGVEAFDAGHPLADRLAAEAPDPARVSDLRAGADLVLGLFPGSRPHVVDALAPEFLEVAGRLRERQEGRLRLLVAAANDELAGRIQALHREDIEDFEIVTGNSFAVMAASDVALTTSGTTTIELAGFETPMVIAYRASRPLYEIGKRLVKVKHLGIVNLIADREIVPEQVGATSLVEGIVRDLAPLLDDEQARARQRDELRGIKNALGPAGSYSRTAERVLEFLALRD